MKTMIARCVARVNKTDEGFAVVELAIGSLLGAVLLAALGTFFMGSMETGSFTQGQSATLNNARNAVQSIEKEVRGADSISWCAPVGDCLEVGARTPTGEYQPIRYTHVEDRLERSEFDAETASWKTPVTIVERVNNEEEQALFNCDTQSTLLRVDVDLHIKPTPDSDPNLNVHTSLRPRNFPEVATCPSA